MCLCKYLNNDMIEKLSAGTIKNYNDWGLDYGVDTALARRFKLGQGLKACDEVMVS